MATPSTFLTAFRTQRASAIPRRRRTPLLVHLGRFAARILPTLAGLRTVVLSVAGFGALTAAAWTVALPLGLAAAGVSLLLLEYLGSRP